MHSEPQLETGAVLKQRQVGLKVLATMDRTLTKYPDFGPDPTGERLPSGAAVLPDEFTLVEALRLNRSASEFYLERVRKLHGIGAATVRERRVACFHATKSRVSMFCPRGGHAYLRLRRAKACHPPVPQTAS